MDATLLADHDRHQEGKEGDKLKVNLRLKQPTKVATRLQYALQVKSPRWKNRELGRVRSAKESDPR